MTYANPIPTPQEIFRCCIEVDGCWLWQGPKIQGYGIIKRKIPGVLTTVRRKVHKVHRIVAIEYCGLDENKDLVPDHLCSNRNCVNPDHLEPVTMGENTKRAEKSPTGLNSRKTHCMRGHSFDKDNTRYIKTKYGTGRCCRECLKLQWTKDNRIKAINNVEKRIRDGARLYNTAAYRQTKAGQVSK